MTTLNNGGPAFPSSTPAWTNEYGAVNEPTACRGMSLRDYFAGQALMGLLSQSPDTLIWPEDFAMQAYEQADAMLKARQSND